MYDFYLSYRNTAMVDPLTAGVLVGLEGITANRVAADIVQDAKGDRVEQIGARDVKATGDAVFKVKQTTD